MKKTLLLPISLILYLNLFSQYSQTRSAGAVMVNWNVKAWLDYSPSSFASNDNVYAYTKTSFGRHPLWFSDFRFSIPPTATVDRIVVTVRKFKKGKSEVKDYPGVTWLIKGCCNYGPSMDDLAPWKTTETEVRHEQPGAGVDQRGNAYKWTPADINDALFGFTFNPTVSIKGGGAALYIDQLVITVYYSIQSSSITMHSGNTYTEPVFDAKVFSNPATSSFQIHITGKDEPVHFKVVDALGRLVESRANLTANSLVSIGNTYTPGLYFAEVIQGSNRKVFRLIKK